MPGYIWCSGQAGIGGADEFDPDLMKDPTRTLIAPYIANNVGIFHCPADTRTGLYDGAWPLPQLPSERRHGPRGPQCEHEPGRRHH